MTSLDGEFLLCTVILYANRAHTFTPSPEHLCGVLRARATIAEQTFDIPILQY
jgi:hypothetical protein